MKLTDLLSALILLAHQTFGEHSNYYLLGGVLLCFLLGRVVLGIASGAVAKAKGYRLGFWWGFLLSWLGFLVVALRPQKVITVRMGPTYPFE